MHNDSAEENGPYTPQIAMAVSINTAYADLWHTVGGPAVASMAQEFGVDTAAACITHAVVGQEQFCRCRTKRASRSARHR